MTAYRSHPFAALQPRRQSKQKNSPLMPAATLAPLLDLWLDCMQSSETDVAYRRPSLSLAKIKAEVE